MNEIIESLKNEVKDSKDKLIVIINGNAGSGKTYLVNNITGIPALELNTVDIYKCLMVDYFNWDGQKDLKTRTILHELKKLHIEYNEGPLRKIIKTYNDFVESDFKILFLHIGEIEEIKKVKYIMKGHCDIKTILIESPNSEDIEDPRYGGNSPSNDFYDVIFINKHDIHSERMFNDLIREMYHDSISRPKVYMVYHYACNNIFNNGVYLVNHNRIINKSYNYACMSFKGATEDIFELDLKKLCSEDEYIRYSINKFKENHNDNESLIIEVDDISLSTLLSLARNISKDKDISFELILMSSGNVKLEVPLDISDFTHHIQLSNCSCYSCLDEYKGSAVKAFKDYVSENQN